MVGVDGSVLRWCSGGGGGVMMLWGGGVKCHQFLQYSV